MRLQTLFTAVIAAFVVVAVFAVGMNTSEAASRQCRRLEARLASMNSDGNPARYRKYARALSEQKRQIRKAAQQARYLGCSAPYGSRRVYTNAPGCNALFDTMDRMHRNLQKLERGVARYGSRRASKRERSRVLAALNAHGCRTVAKKKTKQRDQIAAVERPIDNERAETIERILSEEAQPETPEQVDAGSYRTMCVRTCDGYYFPISFAAPSSQFSSDEKSCKAMCPGVDVALYHHKAVGEEPEDMVSLAGQPYTALPTAFNHRKANIAKVPGCVCKNKKDFSVVGGKERQNVPTPTARPGEELPTDGSGTETASAPSNAAEGSDQNAPDASKKSKSIIFRAPGSQPNPAAEDTGSQEKSAEDGTDAEDSEEKKVRVVGPAFLPEPEETLDLPVPVPSQRP